MNKKNLIILSLFFVIAVVAFFVTYKNDNFVFKVGSREIILFYSENCPHCIKVENFLDENKIAKKVSFEKKSLDNNPANVAELKKKAITCKLTGDIGIPFLWDSQNNKCIIGDEDIINFFSSKGGSASGGKEK